MNTTPLTRTLTLLLETYEGPVPVPARLSYRADDPYAVTASFDVGAGEPVRWVFARDLLDEGMVGPAGDGDVIVSPEVEEGELVIRLHLRSPDGAAVLTARADDVLLFLGETYAMVPAGRESDFLDIEALLSGLREAA